MKRMLLLIIAISLTGCASFQESWTGYNEKNYQEKVAEYKKKAPEGYDFYVEKKVPYEIYERYFRILQVLGKDEVLACNAYSKAWSYEQYKIGQCEGSTYYHIVFARNHEELYEDDNFWATYFKENKPFIYTTVTGAEKKIRSYTIQ